MGTFFAKEYKIDENNLHDFINKLMRGVFSKIDFVDLFSMMDPEKCKDYIIFGEKSIQKRGRLCPPKLYSTLQLYSFDCIQREDLWRDVDGLQHLICCP